MNEKDLYHENRCGHPFGTDLCAQHRWLCQTGKRVCPICLIPMVMVDGVLYLDTGYNGTYVTGDTYDREITSAVQGYEQPTENDQSNFGTGYKYRYGKREGTIEIEMNSLCRIFATEAVRQQIQFRISKAGACL